MSPGEQAARGSVLQWAISRWHAEVANRPLVNIHRRTLDDAWRQVIRHLGGDDEALIGPRHDDLIRTTPPPAAPGDITQEQARALEDALRTTLFLARLKWGNLDANANTIFEAADAALAGVPRE